jgi:hypothetical protein
MSNRTLIDVVRSLSTLDTELTIYAVKPCACESQAVIAREPDDGGLPREAEAQEASYFMEVLLASEFLGAWRASQSSPVSAHDECVRVIEHAIRDA